jgi:hypothetical protein
MSDRVGRKVVHGVPSAGRLMQRRDLVWVLGQQASAKDIAEEMVVPVPGTLSVQRDQEHVAAVQIRQHLAAVRPAGDRVAQGTGQPVEDRGPQQELPHFRALTGKDLVHQVVDDETIAAREGPDELGNVATVRNIAQRKGGQLQTGDPALGPFLERLYVPFGKVQAHHLVEEFSRLRRREAQIRGPYLR